MALEKYNTKRNFSKTKEPKGVRKPSKGALRFVVQKHAASHLHYDFRLEIDGVLVSWAVPKGPSSDHTIKRLAMHVEDHPMDYIDFEGTIPKGEYGGGTVMVWDIGTYHAEGNDDVSKDNQLMKKQLKDQSIKVVLEGGKLKGSYHLFSIKDDKQWLLMKGVDEFANGKTFKANSILTGRDFNEISKGNDVWKSNKRFKTKTVSKEQKEEEKMAHASKSDGQFSGDDLTDAIKLERFPDDWRPQLATLTDAPFDNEDWIFETKYDGYRAMAQIQNKRTTLISRNGLKFNNKYPEIVKSMDGIPQDMVIDGEIVVENDNGKSNFQWLQKFEDNPTKGTLKFYAFDILYFQGYDLRGLDLLLRKKILKAVLPGIDNVVYSEHSRGHGHIAYETAKKNHGEGIIAKKSDSKYNTAKRTKDWLKIKIEKQQEMVIGGFTEPQGSRKGIGALLCGYYQGDDLIYSGKVGSGYTERTLVDLRKRLDRLERKSAPFKVAPKEKNIHWVSPKLIAQLKFSEITESGSMRHPVFLGLRDDKNPKEIGIEKPLVRMTKAEGDKRILDEKKDTFRVEFSNLDKIFWPKENISKGDVIAYYSSISEYILPYLKYRPQSLRRTPDGIHSDGFFQKDVAGKVPKWVKTKKIKSDSAAESITWLICNDEETLLFLANWGCIEINPWSSRVGSLNNPDYIIFDLDPKGAPMRNIVKTAQKLKEVLDKLQVASYIKTSGGNGLHVFIPVKPKYTYEQTREFSHLISQMVHRDLPDITSLERMPAKRKGKVYLDFLQNGKGKTMASIYSLRPREGAGVSTPLDWDEVNDSLDLKAFNIKTVPQRIREKGDLWKDFFNDAVDLKLILEKI
ncbi:MAG: DNA ligase D [Flavobacterium sp. BFFFF1]|uniref:DNA ligase D n=1 Tax=Flavobacterium sp. BFFFF1 TaxID=2015557 RepID=UPI000BC59242|nr:DNA ligase D [Flavobacterium sp. BFFFF1]OYU81682.1 MAG: DNA ligase D [Flavobacterium sp. BFFFF1]